MLGASALLAPNVCFLVARVGGIAAATGAVAVREGYGELKRMFVLPEFRGLGLGRKMLGALLDHLRTRHIGVARLETGILNAEAIALYERAGFRRIGPFGDYVDDPLNVFYELRLA
ncbi:acyl-CoA N-acyltransferase [Hyaloraphidium curvatum]|nr:acyl-CoA N-acyltransferase [Hyaloraphidium curvatum]